MKAGNAERGNSFYRDPAILQQQRPSITPALLLYTEPNNAMPVFQTQMCDNVKTTMRNISIMSTIPT